MTEPTEPTEPIRHKTTTGSYKPGSYSESTSGELADESCWQPARIMTAAPDATHLDAFGRRMVVMVVYAVPLLEPNSGLVQVMPLVLTVEHAGGMIAMLQSEFALQGMEHALTAAVDQHKAGQSAYQREAGEG